MRTTTVVDPAVTPVEKDALSVVERANLILVRSAEEFEKAGAFVAEVVKPMRKRIAEVFDPIVSKAYAAHREACAQKKKLDDPLALAERRVKEQMERFADQQKALRLEAERKAREAAEAEARRLEKEREAKAEELAADGDVEAGVALLEAPPEPVFVQPAPVEIPRAAGVSTPRSWVAEIFDPSLLPREYLIPNEDKINKVIRAAGPDAKIPGVRAVEKTTISIKSR